MHQNIHKDEFTTYKGILEENAAYTKGTIKKS